VRDITARKATEERLLAYTEELEYSKGRIEEQRISLEVFSRALAHDLKEPLRTIRSFAELITEQETFIGKTSSYFNYIKNAARRMEMLINTVVLYTRLDDPAILTKEYCDIGNLLAEVTENLNQLINEHESIIMCDSEVSVYANRIQLAQLLQNLLSNAIRHTPGKVTIKVTVQAREQDWLFSVADNGPGIKQEYINKIFEPFKRLSRDEEHGAGLGLAICKKIIESHGGKIWCESTYGEGATFFFILPGTAPAITSLPNPILRMVPLPDAQETNPLLLANILVVDDRKADLDMTRIMLIERPNLQCNLFTARDGGEALAILTEQQHKQSPIDIMLLDINMPEMDGFEVLEKLQQHNVLNDVIIVMCTGSSYDKDMERSAELGAVAYLVKPVTFDQLEEIIDKSPTHLQLQKENTGYSLRRVS
jgi:CheY-like chemotaxis protein/two-component sensor histidine kinase